MSEVKLKNNLFWPGLSFAVVSIVVLWFGLCSDFTVGWSYDVCTHGSGSFCCGVLAPSMFVVFMPEWQHVCAWFLKQLRIQLLCCVLHVTVNCSKLVLGS